MPSSSGGVLASASSGESGSVAADGDMRRRSCRGPAKVAQCGSFVPVVIVGHPGGLHAGDAVLMDELLQILGTLHSVEHINNFSVTLIG